METLRFAWCHAADPLFEEARRVRQAVFVEEQGFSLEGEFDSIDTGEGCRHLVVFENGRAVGTARGYDTEPGVWQLGRIALLKECRGSGHGAAILEEMRRKAGELGKLTLRLNAQADKAGFYEKAGYTLTGKTMLDEGCPHVEMVRPAGCGAGTN